MVDAPESLVFRAIRQIDPEQGRDSVADLGVRNGQLSSGEGAPEFTGRGIDARGWIVAPGFVDLRAQFFEPGPEYREGLRAGLSAAAAGGFTAVCGMPTTEPPADCGALLSAIKARREGLAGPVLLPLGALTRGLAGKELAEIGELQAAGAAAVTDVHTSQASAQVLRRAFEYAATFDLTVFQHPGDASLERGGLVHEGPVGERLGLAGLPATSEVIGLARDLELVALTGVRYHASVVTTAGAVELIRRAKDAGLPVTADVAAHNLLLTDALLPGYDTHLRLSPPLRDERHREALVRGLRDGVIDAVCSDHTPLAATEKDCEFDQAHPGASALETTLSVMTALVARGELNWREALGALVVGPRRVLRLASASLEPPRPATITVFNPSETWEPSDRTLRGKARNCPFLGQVLHGRVRWTFVDGTCIFSDSENAC